MEPTKNKHKRGYLYTEDHLIRFMGIELAGYYKILFNQEERAINQETISTNGFFRVNRSYIDERYRLSTKVQERLEAILESSNVIEGKTKNVGGKNYRRICFNQKSVEKLTEASDLFWKIIHSKERVTPNDIKGCTVRNLDVDKLLGVLGNLVKKIKNPIEYVKTEIDEPTVEEVDPSVELIIKYWNDKAKSVKKARQVSKTNNTIRTNIKTRLKKKNDDYIKKAIDNIFSCGDSILGSSWFTGLGRIVDTAVHLDDMNSFEKYEWMKDKKGNQPKTSKFGERNVQDEFAQAREEYGELWYFNQLTAPQQEEYIKEHGEKPKN